MVILNQLHKSTVYFNQLVLPRAFSLCAINKQKILEVTTDSPPVTRIDQAWAEAKEFESIPGPTVFEMIRNLFPGGKFYDKDMLEMTQINRNLYGDIYKINGILGRTNIVVTYNPKDFETVFRNEGTSPIRISLESFAYYRHKRADIFQGNSGLASANGELWSDIRNKVNPILMKTNVVRENLTEIDKLSQNLLKRLDKLIDPKTHLLNVSFQKELKMWALESIGYISLNTHFGLIADNPDPKALELAEHMEKFFELSFKYDSKLPHFWKYYETRGFKQLLNTFDNITDITRSYVEKSVAAFEAEPNKEAISVLAKLCRIDKRMAMVMAIDMLMAGLDTTASTFITVLYHLCVNPKKQEQLRKECLTVLPTPDTPLTVERSMNMPYLRACMKEALRRTHITPGTARTTVKDLVLSGYKVPKGTNVVMNVMELANSEQYFPRSKEYLPERWLKSGELACPAAKMTNPFTYLPFGFGPRTCIGKRIAEMEIETLLVRLIRNYKVTWADDKPLTYKSNLIFIPQNDKFAFEKYDE